MHYNIAKCPQRTVDGDVECERKCLGNKQNGWRQRRFRLHRHYHANLACAFPFEYYTSFSIKIFPRGKIKF